jgi:hypothetical protein
MAGRWEFGFYAGEVADVALKSILLRDIPAVFPEDALSPLGELLERAEQLYIDQLGVAIVAACERLSLLRLELDKSWKAIHGVMGSGYPSEMGSGPYIAAVIQSLLPEEAVELAVEVGFASTILAKDTGRKLFHRLLSSAG